MITSRRSFIKVSGATSGALIFGFTLPGFKGKEVEAFEPNAFLRIGKDNSITIQSKNPEIGQGVKTSMPMIIAEELEVNWEKIIVEQSPYNAALGSQFAGGSTAINTNWESLRQAGATARQVLKMAASRKWNVPMNFLKAEDGQIINSQNNTSISYGDLVEEAASIEVPEESPLKDPKDFKIIGTWQNGVDSEKIVTGSIDFGVDVKIDGMLFAAIQKSPVFGGKVVSYDDGDALKIPGVKQIIQIDDFDNPTWMINGVAVLAESTWAAFKGKEALKVEWDVQNNDSESTENISRQFRENTSKAGEIQLRTNGNVDKAFDESDEILEAEYELPFLSHAPMEPQNYLADVKSESAFLSGSTQDPGAARYFAHRLTGLTREQVTVEMTRVGGGFGRRLMADYAAEASFLSKEAGVPVKVVWSREDDIQHDFYRPAGMFKLKAGIKDGELTAWHTRSSSTSRYLFRGSDSSPHKTEIFPDGFPAGFVPNFKMEYTPVKTAVPTGAWRAPGHNSTAFVDQSFIDEVANALKKDPLEYRLELLGDGDKIMPYDDHGGPTYSTARLKAVIRKVGEISNWKDKPSKGIYRGIAAHFMFGAYVAEVVEVSTKNNRLKVEKVYAAVDCGIVVNKAGAMAQIEGGIIDGVGITFNGEITIKDGGPQQDNFDTYKLIRMKEAPDVEVALIESTEHPEGLGEISLPAIPAAVCNAIFAATGKRVRKLPVKLEGLS